MQHSKSTRVAATRDKRCRQLTDKEAVIFGVQRASLFCGVSHSRDCRLQRQPTAKKSRSKPLHGILGGRGPAQHEHVVGEYPEELTFSVAEVSVDDTEMWRCIGQRLSGWKAVTRGEEGWGWASYSIHSLTEACHGTASLPLLVRLSSTTGASNPVPGYGNVTALQRLVE